MKIIKNNVNYKNKVIYLNKKHKNINVKNNFPKLKI